MDQRSVSSPDRRHGHRTRLVDWTGLGLLPTRPHPQPTSSGSTKGDGTLVGVRRPR